ncbi:hypothetical protein JWJ90_07570 [Desulfobulbus rhabdoformis]|uniref:hypothetical protein n=1 Tax=Desulfobulbus rhabdoformis TaxID=34032 RepID=UPI001963C8DC|nr:hypothetical protein [Desulfobulbus rhabdoformis]MBM9614145.1 hypothetical protein [Desulfobulbus rhabdoformis]
MPGKIFFSMLLVVLALSLGSPGMVLSAPETQAKKTPSTIEELLKNAEQQMDGAQQEVTIPPIDWGVFINYFDISNLHRSIKKVLPAGREGKRISVSSHYHVKIERLAPWEYASSPVLVFDIKAKGNFSVNVAEYWAKFFDENNHEIDQKLVEITEKQYNDTWKTGSTGNGVISVQDIDLTKVIRIEIVRDRYLNP